MPVSQARDTPRRRVSSETPASDHTRSTADRASVDARLPEPGSGVGLSGEGMLALQRAAGNHAVAGLVRHVVQRVEVAEPASTETLYNDVDPGTGKATANSYGGQAKYEMTRSGDTGATVTVRMSFVSQSRNTRDPAAPGAPADTPPLGALVGEPTEIPADDPRRAWATNVVGEAVKIWNGRLTFVGEDHPAPDPHAAPDSPPPAPVTKRLPVTFRAEPVFGIGESYHNRIVVHPPTTVAGTPGNPIDAGNYYMNKGTAYDGNDDVITAHEYGHLLGIDDEYSQSNEQLNALLHQAAPAGAPSLSKALDQRTVERMVLAALRGPMVRQLMRVMPQVTDAILAQRAMVRARLVEAAKSGVLSDEVRDQLTTQLQERSTDRVKGDVPAAVAFETTRNYSASNNVAAGMSTVFSAKALGGQIGGAYSQALQDAPGGTITLGDLGDVSVEVHGSVAKTTAAGGAQADTGATLATSSVGTRAPAGGTTTGGEPTAAPGLPAIAPPATLVDRLSALPATWSATGSIFESAITSDAFSRKMVDTLKAAQAVTQAAAALPGNRLRATGRMYREAFGLVTNAARTAVRELSRQLVASTMTPTLISDVSDLQSSVRTEVDRIMGTPASGVAALGTPDPAMTTMVSAMKARLDADKAATAGTGRNPLGLPAGAAPSQDVTYTSTGLMGSSGTTGLRPDQFQPMVQQFNDNLKTLTEQPFKPEAR